MADANRRPAARRPAVVEVEGNSPTKEEMARQICQLKKKIQQKDNAIVFYCREMEKLSESNYRFRVSNGNLKDSYDELKDKNDFLNSMAVDMREQSKAMEAERRLWRDRENVLINDKNRSVMDRAHWKREAQHYKKKLDLLVTGSFVHNLVKYDDGQTGPSADDAIMFEFEMEAIENEDKDIDEVQGMFSKMK
jgi:FtsZ-binding cell division protein ZapB